MTEGDLFGEIAAIDGLPRSAWVYSLDECYILEIPGAIFKSLARGNQDFAFVLLEKLSKNLREMNDRLIQIFSLDVESRACIELLRMARPGSRKSNDLPGKSNADTDELCHFDWVIEGDCFSGHWSIKRAKNRGIYHNWVVHN